MIWKQVCIYNTTLITCGYCDTNIVCYHIESNESMQKLHEGIEDLERGSYYNNNIV